MVEATRRKAIFQSTLTALACPPAAAHQLNPHRPPEGPSPLCQAGRRHCRLRLLEPFLLSAHRHSAHFRPPHHPLPFANALKAPSTVRTIPPPLQRRGPQDLPPLLGKSPNGHVPCCLSLGLEHLSPVLSPDRPRSLFQDAAEAWHPRSLPHLLQPCPYKPLSSPRILSCSARQPSKDGKPLEGRNCGQLILVPLMPETKINTQ